MGQVEMATDHGGERTSWPGGVGSPIGRLSLGQPEEDARRARAGC